MENLYRPKTIVEAKATIQAEFDRIAEDSASPSAYAVRLPSS